MKTNVRDTSLEAYYTADLSQQAKSVFNYLHAHQGMTRREIASGLGIDVSSVAGRINELVKAGSVAENIQRKCSVTGRTAWALTAVTRQEKAA